MILITGASGNSGSEVLKQIIRTGAKIRAAFQSPEKAATAPSGVEIAIMDYTRPETISKTLTGVERVFLVGPVAPNLAALEANVVAAAKKAGVRHIVKFSAMGGRQAIFPKAHADSEDNIKASGIPYTFLRPNGFMQNFALYNAGTINSQNAFYGCQGQAKVSHIDLRDVAAVAVKALTESGHEGKAYELTGPAALSNEEIAQILSDDTGREILYVDLPAEEFEKALRSAGMPDYSVRGIVDLQLYYHAGKASAVTPDIEQVLGRKPTSFEQFSRDYVSAFKTEEKAAS